MASTRRALVVKAIPERSPVGGRSEPQTERPRSGSCRYDHESCRVHNIDVRGESGRSDGYERSLHGPAPILNEALTGLPGARGCIPDRRRLRLAVVTSVLAALSTV